MQRIADVVIVGAGLSGLIAAREVLRAGLQPLVVEANDRVGGRILTEQPRPGVQVELGAQWIGDTHHRMFALAAELGHQDVPAVRAGRDLLRDRRLRGAARERLPRPVRHRAGRRCSGCWTLLDELAAQVPLDAPWTAPRAAEWDAITAGAWYTGRAWPRWPRTLLEICTVGILAVPTVEVSFLDLLVNLPTCGVGAAAVRGVRRRRADDPVRRWHQPDPAAAGRPARRAHRARLAGPAHRARPRLGAPCTAAGAWSRRGRRVIVAIAPTLAGRIMYDPPLPGVRDQLTQRMPQASAMKAFFVYDEPFWRADGLNGQLISDLGPGPDVQRHLPGRRAGTASYWSSWRASRPAPSVAGREAERREALTDELVRHFGPRAGRAGALHRRRMGRPAVDPRLLQREHGPVGLDQLRARAERTDRRDPLGGHRDGYALERVHGGRRRGR